MCRGSWPRHAGVGRSGWSRPRRTGQDDARAARQRALFIEEIDNSTLFRWFIGLCLDDPIWSPTTFSKNRDRLLEGDIAAAFFDPVRAQAEAAGLLSDEHLTVDSRCSRRGPASRAPFQREIDRRFAAL